ncbi:HAD-IA family hydrolase [Acinetobacter sichuanensis]|uniref:HAD-IA family hydrolase n=1 Tax=Acinetobacter sichuanensis TaxID=2136183 RepID=UPI0028106D10|nr:HAD-IA family hydrolase [Acinetobacter sichuanensis]MDQ9020327.1 HAD-IA family hydrolase [Acinetobacter sichuanensis]
MSDCIKPIIMFDMDGTLLDLAFDDLIWNHQLPERHAATHQCSLEQSHHTLHEFYQQHKHTLLWYSSKYWTAKVGVDVLQLQADFQHKIAPRQGCFELLKQLKAQGYRCWLVTNADRAGLQLKLENVDLSPYFEVMVSSEEIGYAKEFVEFWQILQQQHPFDPQHAMLIDDTTPVLQGAEKFGIQRLVTIRQPSSLKAARHVLELEYPSINDLTELLPLLTQDQLKDVDVKTA